MSVVVLFALCLSIVGFVVFFAFAFWLFVTMRFLLLFAPCCRCVVRCCCRLTMHTKHKCCCCVFVVVAVLVGCVAVVAFVVVGVENKNNTNENCS